MTNKPQSTLPVRIIVTESFNIHTSEFIQTASEKVVRYSTRYNLEEGVFDFELGITSLNLNDSTYDIELLTPPGGRANVIFDYRQIDKISLIVMVDNTKPETFREARSLVETYQYYGASPCIIAVINFYEDQGRWDFVERWEQQSTPMNVEIMPCVPSDEKSVDDILNTLCEKAIKELEQLRSENILRTIILDTKILEYSKTKFIASISNRLLPLAETRILREELSSGIHPIRPNTEGLLSFTLEDTDYVLHLETPQFSQNYDYALQSYDDDTLMGFIVLVDSTDPMLFRLTKAIIETLIAYDLLPLIIAADKQDESGAWNVEDLRIALSIPDEIPVVPCVATDKKSVANVLIALCEEVLKEVEEDAPE